MSWETIREKMGYSCSADLIRWAMASMGYHKCQPCRKFKVRPKNRPIRVEWAQAHLHWTFEDWSRIVFSDETYFSTIGFSHRPMVIRNAAEEFHPDCIDDWESSGRSGIMAWGAFCGQKKSDLVFVPSKVTIDSATYTKQILDRHLIPFWHAICEE